MHIRNAWIYYNVQNIQNFVPEGHITPSCTNHCYQWHVYLQWSKSTDDYQCWSIVKPYSICVLLPQKYWDGWALKFMWPTNYQETQLQGYTCWNKALTNTLASSVTVGLLPNQYWYTKNSYYKILLYTYETAVIGQVIFCPLPYLLEYSGVLLTAMAANVSIDHNLLLH